MDATEQKPPGDETPGETTGASGRDEAGNKWECLPLVLLGNNISV